MSRLNVAVDFGNSNVKAVCETGETIAFPSGYAVADYSIGDEFEMEYDKKFYTIGNRQAIEYDKTDSDRMKICTLQAVGALLVKSNVPSGYYDVNIATDIPISLFGKMKQAYKKYYDSVTARIKMAGRMYTITFANVDTYPQGVVSWAANRQKFAEYSEIVAIDIGGRTVDIATISVDQFTKVPQYLNKISLQTGILDLVNEIDYKLQMLGIQLPEKTIENTIMTMEIRHRDSFDIIRIIDEAKRLYVKNLSNSLFENKIDSNLPVLLVGGGADLLEDELVNEFDVIENLGYMANAASCLKCMMSK